MSGCFVVDDVDAVIIIGAVADVPSRCNKQQPRSLWL